MDRMRRTDHTRPTGGSPNRGASENSAAEGAPGAAPRSGFPIPDGIQEASELLKVVGDLTRMRLLCALLQEGELSVGDLQNALGMSQSAVSHQLRVLRDARLVGFERIGKTVRYSLADDHVRDLLRVVLEHARHD